MANGTIIIKAKNQIINEFIKDNKIIEAIDSSIVSKDSPENLIGTHIFDFYQEFDNDSKETFLTVQVNIPQPTDIIENFVKPTIEVCIISHEKHMKMENTPDTNVIFNTNFNSNVSVNRNDYLSVLIDKKLNGMNLGVGNISLISNVEGLYQKDFVYRKLIFQATDLNKSFCADE